MTFGNENTESMEPFFRGYGFTVDGISPQRYRDDGYEVIMGKRFVYKTVGSEEFLHFVNHDVFRMTGYDTYVVDDGSFIATPRHKLYTMLPPKVEERFYVRVDTSPSPERSLQVTIREAKDHNAFPVLCSLYGMPASQPTPSEIEVLDGFTLENMFFPVELERPDQKDLIIPIQTQWIPRLLPDTSQSTLLPHKAGLRTDNVYYKTARGTADLRRGARLIFYETSDKKRLIGTGRLVKVDKGSPQTLFSRYGGQGAWSRREVFDELKGKPSAALLFEWYEPFPRKVPLQEIQGVIPKFNPITTFAVQRVDSNILLERGGVR